MRKFFSVFSSGTKIFCLNFMGYEIFFGILEFHSAPVPGIKTDRSLKSYATHKGFTLFFYSFRPDKKILFPVPARITFGERIKRYYFYFIKVEVWHYN